MTTGRSRADLLARVCVTVGALLPYWRFLSFNVLFVTDDVFTSDIFNGELPGRVLIGQLIRHGELPVWTNQLCSGLPLAGAPADPIGLAAFTLLSPAAALDLLVVVLLLIAAHGAYGLSRRIGADRGGSVLAGIAFAGSGYVAAQLKHLGIISTVVWLPVGLNLLHRALGDVPASRSRAERSRCLRDLTLFGLVFAVQILAGFPQSAYICALVYGAFALTLVAPRIRDDFASSVRMLASFAAVSLVGAAAGAVVLMPLAELSAISDRVPQLGFNFATYGSYWPRNILTFLVPYINGDISNNSYIASSVSFFWEDYGYVGAATFVLAIFGAARQWRRRDVAFVIAASLLAYLLVLGPATPIFRIAYTLVPGMSLFRFPTRFLIVVELGLAVLAAVSMTTFVEDLRRQYPALRPRSVHIAMIALVGLTAIDLWYHQPRQNAVVPADSWLTPPASVATIENSAAERRTFSPQQVEQHRRAFLRASAWQDVKPYYELRDLLQPNIGGGYWGVPSADCYSGIAPQWIGEVWGDRPRGKVTSELVDVDFDRQTTSVDPRLPKILGTYGVGHLLTPFPLAGGALPLESHDGTAYVYRVDDAARVRFVTAALSAGDDQHAAAQLLNSRFDPDRSVLLHGAPESIIKDVADHAPTESAPAPRVAIRDDGPRQTTIDADVSADGFLLLADTYYPGWAARIDDTVVPIYRANISSRAVALPRGHHVVRFTYEATTFMRGLTITLSAIASLVLGFAVTAYRAREATA